MDSEKKSQKQKFLDAAREHGCDESEEVFTKKLKKIANKSKNKGQERPS